MSVVLGSGEHRYRMVESWAKLPDGWEFRDVAAVAVDSRDRVYVFNRGQHPMIVLDRDGNFLRSWGEGLFSRTHGIDINSDDILYCTEVGITGSSRRSCRKTSRTRWSATARRSFSSGSVNATGARDGVPI